MSNDTSKATTDETEALMQAEAERKRRGLLTIGAALVASSVLLVIMWVVSGGQGPQIDVEAANAEALELTNDPQCRAFIADLTEIGQDFRRAEPDIDANLLSDDVAKIDEALLSIKGIRDAIDAQELASSKAELRYDDSRKELDVWFEHIDRELALLYRLGEERKSAIAPPDGTFEVEFDENGKATAKKDKAKKAKKDKRTPRQLLDAALVVIYDDFANFRVWHSDRGSMHPCGAASEGETPWTEPTE